LPARIPFFFARLVAAFSAGESDFQAAAGRYRSPVSSDGLPLLVRQFWLVQSRRDF